MNTKSPNAADYKTRLVEKLRQDYPDSEQIQTYIQDEQIEVVGAHEWSRAPMRDVYLDIDLSAPISYARQITGFRAIQVVADNEAADQLRRITLSFRVYRTLAH